ncbi:hypothetical protein BDY24DRAFT_385497 [Mrakia frigida]|uniref:zinc finger MYND domain-containing protein n=1 Tax=Mrakia frigida TaxID=29902 RepID=UPI003FCC1948
MLESVERFRAEFSSKHLHRYICLLIERLPHITVPWSSSFELRLATVLLGSNFFTRWIRTAPADTVELLFVLLVEQWEKSCPDLATLFEGPRTATQLLGTRGQQYTSSLFYAQQISLIIVYLPSQIDLRSSSLFSSPSTLPRLGRDLQTLSDKCHRLLNSSTTDSVLKDGMHMLAKTPQIGLEIILRYLHHEESAQEVRHHFQSLPGWKISWFECAATSELSKDSCPILAGEELRACGRCQTVRYCSKDHQRAHWKKHKHKCFAVEWDFS